MGRKCLGVAGHEMWHSATTVHLLNIHSICSQSMNTSQLSKVKL